MRPDLLPLTINAFIQRGGFIQLMLMTGVSKICLNLGLSGKTGWTEATLFVVHESIIG